MHKPRQSPRLAGIGAGGPFTDLRVDRVESGERRSRRPDFVRCNVGQVKGLQFIEPAPFARGRALPLARAEDLSPPILQSKKPTGFLMERKYFMFGATSKETVLPRSGGTLSGAATTLTMWLPGGRAMATYVPFLSSASSFPSTHT